MLVISTVLVLLLAVQGSVANPGGNGDENRDFNCAGSCHGDPAFNQQSSAEIDIVSSSESFAGTAYQFEVIINNPELSSNRLLGAFLLSSTNGNGDHPEKNGWNIIQDPNGGSSNYVESVVPSSGSINLVWILETPQEQQITELIVEIHHGANPNEMNRAFFGLSEPHQIEVIPVPENLPGFAADWSAPSYRTTGDTSPILLLTENTTSVEVLWMLEGESQNHITTVELVEENQWLAYLPATMGDTRILYQVKTSNEEFEVAQPWLTMGTQEPEFDGTIWGAGLQGFAGALIILAIVVNLQAILQPQKERSKIDQTSIVEESSHNNSSNPENSSKDYLDRLVKYDEYPDLLWDPVEEEWVKEPNSDGD